MGDTQLASKAKTIYLPVGIHAVKSMERGDGKKQEQRKKSPLGTVGQRRAL